MHTSTLIILLLGLMSLAYYFGRKRSLSLVGGKVRDLHSLPSYYGLQTAMWCGIPALILLAFWISFEESVVTGMVIESLPQEIQNLPPERLNLVLNDVRNLSQGDIVSSTVDQTMQQAADHYTSLMDISHMALFVVALSVAILAGLWAQRTITREQRARNRVEKAINFFLLSSSTLAIFTTIGIVLSVLFESVRFFQQIPVTEFLFGLEWSPQTAIRPDQVGSSGVFGSIPLFAGTMLITLIAMIVAVPIGLMSAIYMAEYASKHFRTLAKPVLEVLAGIPTVVYGFFAALTVAPFFRDLGTDIGLTVSSESALAAGVVMGIMIIPFVSSLSDDVINAVPQAMRDGSYGLGATRSETIRNVIIPAALPGIVGGVLLAVSRAIGETMIVVMAAGLSANLTANPLEAVTTVTVQIVTLLVGDQEFDSAKTLAAFALALVLFVITLALNMIALHIVRKYREQYE
ncbi:MAG: phosphate ABC transporter permease subunit PstC [Candidatus Thiodiazotropha sp. (ex Ctena orbiculata)]|uniref:Phosphate transport system permease protein n=1 Tax=Candidatus Thiodiazotropha taylori TaxID=2792791 RepID=A0A9E4N331_9GAMM|nr:phosphate ABC transporter permease subunit PstC [Candidatus Thiodiazotropha taylori]RLW71062.1 MAG: phosphate ABC transporter permease subunit PstC [gamma proteobacterium symbiont of Stewartia floridana]MCG7945277.1 phosphate ABC transporter permease subunit PstC [Candidatus Thiodiazotropha taylori]MCG7966323.1 phosphate ABC transporter permease subunit PstC [Candidatus Thiodiazotropha taylori]MCG8041059.1 phosphate ABC transporter permease subunit PstC [Candidatus Thiodiazotropha taylori]